MSESALDVNVDDYRVVMDSTSLTVYRHGRVWRNVTGDNCVLAMAQEIQSLRAIVQDTANEILSSVGDHDVKCDCSMCLLHDRLKQTLKIGWQP